MIVGEEGIHIKDLYYVLMKARIGNVKYCKTLIKHHHVEVNGQLSDDVCLKVSSTDIICVDKNRIQWPFVYYMLNKPAGYLSANYDRHEHYVLELFHHDDCFCLGRLDKDTTGLLIVTNDASLKSLLLPENHVMKIYEVVVDKRLNDEVIESFNKGVIIDRKILCHRAELEILDQMHCLVTIDEGKYHQIKKMFLSCGYHVLSLKRLSFGDIHLDTSLNEGEYRMLYEDEVNMLYTDVLRCKNMKRGEC